MRDNYGHFLKVCNEAPVDLIVNGRKIITFMCTPEDLTPLAIGYLFSRGLITSIDEIKNIGACNEIRKIIATTKELLSTETHGLGVVLSSACGTSTKVSDDFLKRKANDSKLQITVLKLREMAIKMFKDAAMYQETGGVHCAALVDSNGILYQREDIGRHNAVDKIIGHGLINGVDLTHSAIITTGRISSDMILKAVACKVPIVVSRSIPSSLALEIAESQGITIVGRIVSNEPFIYSHSQRVVNRMKAV
ncbi:formate dehydrogenase accessory sulfurtransferase FdhD [Alkaliphilus transvaalensis]|uniref:formate dehydrogenase accessory sulfurtransferase FdhD n=1 Tax=Alkaliphilus transvaalensis TaxID=114628 RepID=UPI00047E186C|nr:formate dehydrogenase accessory sulfurtransferase FdhD [Alkaliphilus transvaalensis]